MNVLDKEKLVSWLEKRVSTLEDRNMRDYGGGLVDNLGRQREAKMILNMIKRKEMDAKVWE